MNTAVLFDWDGTLMDSHSAILAAYRSATTSVIGRRFPDTQDEIDLIRPMRAQQSFPLLSDDPKTVAEMIAAYNDAYVRESVTTAHAFPGVERLLGRLRDGGQTLAVVSSKAGSRIAADAVQESLDSFFDTVISGDTSAEVKPHPGPILDALAALEVPADQAIYVGDGPQDVIAGRDAGVFTVGVTYGLHSAAEVAGERPDALANNIDELESAILGAVAIRAEG